MRTLLLIVLLFTFAMFQGCGAAKDETQTAELSEKCVSVLAGTTEGEGLENCLAQAENSDFQNHPVKMFLAGLSLIAPGAETLAAKKPVPTQAEIDEVAGLIGAFASGAAGSSCNTCAAIEQLNSLNGQEIPCSVSGTLGLNVGNCKNRSNGQKISMKLFGKKCDNGGGQTINGKVTAAINFNNDGSSKAKVKMKKLVFNGHRYKTKKAIIANVPCEGGIAGTPTCKKGVMKAGGGKCKMETDCSTCTLK